MTRLSSKNQVTLPVDAVRKAGLKPGDELNVAIDEEGRILLTSAKTESVIEEISGCLTGVYGPNYLEQLRAGDQEREVALGLIIEEDDE